MNTQPIDVASSNVRSNVSNLNVAERPPGERARRIFL
jgi:hypothetical protein